ESVHTATESASAIDALSFPKAVSSVGAARWKQAFAFPVLLAVVLGASVFVFDSGSIADPDIWWHLRNAEVLVYDHQVVRADSYSYTARGSEWINEAWLSELPYYFAW